jgi:hypothetical protein
MKSKRQTIEQSPADQERGSLWELLLFAVLFVVVFSAVARAEDVGAPAPAVSASRATLVAKDPDQRFKMVTTLEQYDSLYVTGTGEDINRAELGVRPSYTFNKAFTVGLLLEGIQDEKPQEFDFGRTYLSGSYSKGIDLFAKRVKFKPGLTLGFPLSRETKAASMKLVTFLSGKFAANPDYLLWKKMSLDGSLSIGKYFHDYTTTGSGEVNTEYVSLQSFTIGWNLTAPLSVSLEVLHYDALSYQSSHADYLGHREEIDFAMNNQVSIGVGHQWGDPYESTLKSNGQDFNLAPEDSSSLIFGNVTVKI